MNRPLQPVDHPRVPFDPDALLRVLEVSRRLSAPCSLTELLNLVIDAGREVLNVERGSIFLYDAHRKELFTTVATGSAEIRFGIDAGIAGHCARTREITNVKDCYNDARFNPEVDRATGYRTRSLMALPLIGLEDELVGVLELLNPSKPFFEEADEELAKVLASQAAAAIQRTRLLEDRLEKIKLKRDLALARQIQMNVLPKVLPRLPGYDLAGFSVPAEETGGDIYDLLVAHPVHHSPDARLAHIDTTPTGLDRQTNTRNDPVMILLADASGHGIGPALSVTQVRSMVRIGAQLTDNLDELFQMVGQQLSEDLREGRFVTTFLGVLDGRKHVLKYHSGGQGPLLHIKGDGSAHHWIGASTVPLGIKHIQITLEPPDPIVMDPGDRLVLLTDGFYEHADPDGEFFGKEGVLRTCMAHPGLNSQDLLAALFDAVMKFGRGATQIDDISGVIVQRLRG
jgi:phosphoserine phosphatase RsbU/P